MADTRFGDIVDVITDAAAFDVVARYVAPFLQCIM
jgi:hypothetical protein